MPYARLEESGCGIHKNRAKLRIDMFMEPTDPHYDKCYVYVPVFPPEGYPGKVDKEGTPVDQKDYDAWEASLPHVWQNNPFHSHFIHPEIGATDNQIKTEIERTLTYFYSFHKACWDADKKFIDEWKKVPSRAGDVRCPFVKGVETDKPVCEAKVANILSRVQEFQIGKKISGDFELPTGHGTINIGADATNRGSNGGSNFSYIDLNLAANADGTIDTWQIYPQVNIAGFKVGTLYLISSTTYKCRDVEAIGNVTVGAPDPDVFTGCSTDVITGDFPGCYFSSGSIERDTSGFVAIRYVTGGGDYITIGTEANYATLRAYDAISLHGTGVESGGGWSGEFCGVAVSEFVGVTPAEIDGV